MSLVQHLLNFFRAGPRRRLLADSQQAARLYRYWRWSVFISITFGYAFFYTARLSFSVAKKPLIDSGLLDAEQLGKLGFALLITYAAGKLANGVIADRVNAARFFATGLILAAACNIIFGLSSSYPLFLVLWAANGWLQSCGAPTCGVSMASWFAHHELGTRYALWCTSHNMGEGITFAFTTLLVNAAGWRWGFLGPGIVCVVVALIVSRTMADRPGTLGLPPINEFKRPPAAGPTAAIAGPTAAIAGSTAAIAGAVPAGGRPLRELQLEVLRNPKVWILALSSALMYVPRYAVNHWGVLYLQIEKQYSLVEAGFVTSLFPLVGIAGSMLSGIISDRFFGARRSPVCLAYGLLFIVSLGALFFAPSGHPWIVRLAMAAAGFAIGGLLVFLGGLTAMDLSSKRAAGAALGLVGGVSYAGAAAQDWVSGRLIERSRRLVHGAIVYDFGAVKYIWFVAACLSTLLPLTVWRAEQRPPGD